MWTDPLGRPATGVLRVPGDPEIPEGPRHVCMYTYTYLHTSIYIYICIHTYIHTYLLKAQNSHKAPHKIVLGFKSLKI